jgi:hypothetical protein
VGQPGEDSVLERRAQRGSTARHDEKDIVGCGRLELGADRAQIVVRVEENQLLAAGGRALSWHRLSTTGAAIRRHQPLEIGNRAAWPNVQSRYGAAGRR